MAKKRISIAAGKAKGRRLQQEVAKNISDILDIPWGKDRLIDSRPGSQNGVDVILIGEALERFPFSVEAKYQEKFAIPQWIKQAKANIIPGTDWLLIFRKNRFDPCALFDIAVLYKYQFEMSNIYYDKKSWRIETWVRQAREEFGSDWRIELEVVGETNLIVMEMSEFFSHLGDKL
jgi:hypothetical protein